MTLVYMEKVSAVSFPVQQTTVGPVNMHGCQSTAHEGKKGGRRKNSRCECSYKTRVAVMTCLSSPKTGFRG